MAGDDETDQQVEVEKDGNRNATVLVVERRVRFAQEESGCMNENMPPPSPSRLLRSQFPLCLPGLGKSR
jgi:hypothetical protein